MKINNKNPIEFFKTEEQFIIYLKSVNFRINYDNILISSLISKVYYNILNDISDSKYEYYRFYRTLSKLFGFKCSMVSKIEYYLERGFSEKEFDNYRALCSKKQLGLSKSKDRNLDNIICEILNGDVVTYTFGYNNTFTQRGVIYCKICNCIPLIDRIKKHTGNIEYQIIKCSNTSCKAYDKKKLFDMWQAFLPSDIYNKKYKDYCESKIWNTKYWINTGLTKEEAKSKIQSIQKHNASCVKNNRSITKDYLISIGYSEEEARIAKLTPSQKDFWMLKHRFSEEEAIAKISEIQRVISSKLDQSKIIQNTKLQFYLNKGLSEEEAIKALSERQSTFSLKKCIDRYGEDDGIKVFNERTNKWIDSLQKNGNMKNGYSKISQDIFNDLKFKLDDECLFATNNGEFRLKKNKGGYAMYDFCYESTKSIIEYHGDMFHSNPNIYGPDDYTNPFNEKYTAKEIWEKDKEKLKLAEKNGYKVMVVWDSEFRNVSKENYNKMINKCLKFINNE